MIDFQEIASSFSTEIKIIWQTRVKYFYFAVERERKKKIAEDANEPQKEKKEGDIYIFLNETLLLKTAQFATKFWRTVSYSFGSSGRAKAGLRGTGIEQWAIQVTFIRGPGFIRADLSATSFHLQKDEAAKSQVYQSRLHCG